MRINDMNTSLTKRYMVSVSLLKEMVMGVIDNIEGFNTIHIPKWQIVEGVKTQVPDEFYMQFLSERYQEDPKKPGKYGWFKTRNRNEALDVFLYAIAAAARHNIASLPLEFWAEYYNNLIEEN